MDTLKKFTIVAATLAMITVSAGPAMAQSSAVGGDVQFQFQNADQSISQVATVEQSNEGDDNIGSAVSQNTEIEQNAANVAVQSGGSFGAGVSGDFDGNGFADWDNDGNGFADDDGNGFDNDFDNNGFADRDNDGNGFADDGGNGFVVFDDGFPFVDGFGNDFNDGIAIAADDSGDFAFAGDDTAIAFKN